MVEFTLCPIATSMTLLGRVLDTIHQALSVAGGPFLDKHNTLISFTFYLTVYKYIMAGLVDPYSYLIGNP